jgi:hypothetical protein
MVCAPANPVSRAVARRAERTVPGWWIAKFMCLGFRVRFLKGIRGKISGARAAAAEQGEGAEGGERGGGGLGDGGE